MLWDSLWNERIGISLAHDYIDMWSQKEIFFLAR